MTPPGGKFHGTLPHVAFSEVHSSHLKVNNRICIFTPTKALSRTLVELEYGCNVFEWGGDKEHLYI